MQPFSQNYSSFLSSVKEKEENFPISSLSLSELHTSWTSSLEVSLHVATSVMTSLTSVLATTTRLSTVARTNVSTARTNMLAMILKQALIQMTQVITQMLQVIAILFQQLQPTAIISLI